MAGYNVRTQFTATVHAEPGEVPLRVWRLIQLRYSGGNKVSIVYAAEPTDRSELPQLMWHLQRAASAYGFEVSVTDADGMTTQAPPISSASRRAGAR